jgi:hypothetical protein
MSHRCEAEAGTRSDLWHRSKQLEEKLGEATQKLGVTTRALKAAERQLGECAGGLLRPQVPVEQLNMLTHWWMSSRHSTTVVCMCLQPTCVLDVRNPISYQISESWAACMCPL